VSITRYLPAARYAAQAVAGILARLGLTPYISRFVLTETQKGHVWLFVVLEVSQLDHPEDYSASHVLDQLSTSLHGLPVVVSQSYGLRYAVLLSSTTRPGPPQQRDPQQRHPQLSVPQLGETNITWQIDVPHGRH
jgi:hypothetical protein